MLFAWDVKAALDFPCMLQCKRSLVMKSDGITMGQTWDIP